MPKSDGALSVHPSRALKVQKSQSTFHLGKSASTNALPKNEDPRETPEVTRRKLTDVTMSRAVEGYMTESPARALKKSYQDLKKIEQEEKSSASSASASGSATIPKGRKSGGKMEDSRPSPAEAILARPDGRVPASTLAWAVR